MRHRIAILIPYFGEWPVWINFFLESCRANATVDWILFCDADPPENCGANTKFIQTSFEDYRQTISEGLGIRVGAEVAYKLCDVRPALPYVHSDLVRSYDFVGTGDLDVIYGDLRGFYTSEILDSYDLLSTHADRVSGHLTLMRNSYQMITAFQRIRTWKKTFESRIYRNFDERDFYNLFVSKRFKLLPQLRSISARCFFREAYSTPGATDRMRWFWRNGRLTNEFYTQHPFMYLHFMSWHNDRWYGSNSDIAPGTVAPWKLLDRVVQVDWREARGSGFTISPSGIQPLEVAQQTIE